MSPTDVPDLNADVPKVCTDRKTAMPSEMKDIFDADKEGNHWESHILKVRDKAALSGGYGMSTSSANPGRSAERWRRLALLRSGGVEPNPGPPRARSRGEELLTADITSGSATKYHRALDNLFRHFPCCDSCSLLLAHGLQFVFYAATSYLE